MKNGEIVLLHSSFSILNLYILKPLPKLGRLDLGLGLAPLGLGPLPEVEIDRADAVLDAAPQNPADIRHAIVQPHARDLALAGLAEVGRAEPLDLLGREVALVADVAQLEARVVVATVLI